MFVIVLEKMSQLPFGKLIKNGKPLLKHKSKQSAILTFDWDLEKMDLISTDFEVEYIF